MVSPEKYYSVKHYYPNAVYPRNDGSQTIIKTIRISHEENLMWDSKKIHALLSGRLENERELSLLRELYKIVKAKMKTVKKLTVKESKTLEFIEDILNIEN